MAGSSPPNHLASDLLDAVIHDDDAKVRLALKSGADPNCNLFWGNGWTPPLHYACLKGNLSTVMLLVKGGANTRRHGGKLNMSPLHWACRYGHEEVASYLIDNDLCDLSAVDEKGETALDKALSNVTGAEGFVTAAYSLVSRGCGSRKHKLRLLIGACRKGKMSIVKDMINKYGVNPSEQSRDKDTALHQACAGGQLTVARYLIEEQNCPTSTKGCYSNSILHCACYSGHLGLVMYLVESAKVDTRAKSENGRLPLHYACVYGFRDIVEYLVVKANCDITVMDDFCHTPLHRACFGDSLEVVKYLVEELNCDYSGEAAKLAGTDTVLHCACQGGHMPTIRYLVDELKCNFVEYKGDSGGCPIHQACSKGQLAVVQYLIEELNCDPNIRGQSGMSPLHYASYEGHMEVVEYLAPKVGTAVTDSYGRTALTIAEQGDKADVVAFLKLLALNPAAYQEAQHEKLDQKRQGISKTKDSLDNTPNKAAALSKESTDILQFLVRNLKLNQDKSIIKNQNFAGLKAVSDIRTEDQIARCLRDLRRSMWSMRDVWEDIAIELEIPDSTRKGIKEREGDSGSKLTAMLEAWLMRRQSAKDLLEALRFKILNRPDVADDIERKIKAGALLL